FAHGQGFLHRDVKPQNILRLPTSYVLADFGVARMADAGQTTSLRMVSYRHAAPQTIDGEAPAAVDDIWSLGSTLFTLLSGTAPFASDNPDEDTLLSYLGRLRSAEPRPLYRPDVPPELTDVISRCLRKERAQRYPDAATLRAAFSSALVLELVATLSVSSDGPYRSDMPIAPRPSADTCGPLLPRRRSCTGGSLPRR
ncbi:protein kinase, partial [Kibdelosporangium lantanae]